jgi:hypothetical protein
MAATAVSRIIAEFYRGIEFPDDWADKPAFITAGLARERVFSCIVLLDANTQPLAASWQAAEHDERFVRIRFDEGAEDDLLDDFDDDLREQSSKVGTPDLFATMLWEPDALRPDQGVEIHPARSSPFGYRDEWGWNIATREIVARASDLLLVTREVTPGLSLAVPANAEEMHQETIEDDGDTFVILPAKR